MATYQYDEGGNMSLFFLLTFLVITLIPVSFTVSPTATKSLQGCQCESCVRQRKTIAKIEANPWYNPFGLSKKGVFLALGWPLLFFVCYRLLNIKSGDTQVYDPYEILGIRIGTPEKEIKSIYKKLSRAFHPDKRRPTVNETIEFIQERFVKITKAYKALTDENIRKNWEEWGHPDGRQETSMGVAIPPWVVETKNNIWVLGFYGLLFGIGLPTLVGRWWYGTQRKTKDGISIHSAAALFKSLESESDLDAVVGAIGKAYQWDHPQPKQSSQSDTTLDRLEKEIEEKAGIRWRQIRDLVGVNGEANGVKKRSLILLYAHLLRLPIEREALRLEQAQILLQTPLLLNALLSMSTSRNWLGSTLSILRLHAYLTQALLPLPGIGNSRARFAQLPGIKLDEVELDGNLAPAAKDYRDFVKSLEDAGDSRGAEARKAVAKWGRLDVVDASFKVAGERIILPSALVFLVVKLRLVSPLSPAEEIKLSEEEIKANEEKDREFLLGSKAVEDVVFKNKDDPFGYAHAPHWPANKTPGWYLVLADEKGSKLVTSPIRITEIPFSGSLEGNRDYRTYRVNFQAPNSVGDTPWKVYFISDTFVGEEVSKNLTLHVEDWSELHADEQASEDEISDPDEDTLAGQMAAMRGGKVKKHADDDDDDEDEDSTTDGDESSEESDSDSDSD